MQTLYLSLLILGLFSIIGSSCYASELGEVTHKGSGCPEGSVSFEASTGEGLIAKFSELTAEATSDAPRVRKSCVIRIPVTVPAGFRLGLGRIAVSGSAQQPSQGESHVSVRFFVAGTSGRATIRAFDAQSEGDFAFESERSDIHWLGCGESPELLAQVELIARIGERDDTSAASESAMLRVSDLILPPLLYRRCEIQ